MKFVLKTGHDFMFSDEQELMMDVLRYNAHVEVLTPPSLRNAIADVAKTLTAQYSIGQQAH